MFYSKLLKLNVISKAFAMARTISQDPLLGYKFRVTIAGLPMGVGFQKVSGLSRETSVITYIENMFDNEHKLPGREKVGELTLTRGCYADAYLQSLYEDVLTNDAIRNTVTLSVCDRFGNIKRTFQLGECWFSKFELADLDASSEDVLIETLTMQFESFL